MDFELSEEHKLMKRGVKDIASQYGVDYWQEIHETGRQPTEIFEDLAEGGWFGAPLPVEYGGQGLNLLDTVIVLEALCDEHCWETTFRFTMSTVFGGISLVENGTEEQKERYIPEIAEEGAVWALGMTEPDAGLNSARISTFAEKDGDEYVINGRKQWISGMEFADHLLLIARTTPYDEVDNRFDGLTMFIVDPDDPAIEYSEIPLDMYYTEPTYDLFIEDLRVHEDQVLGEVGNGLYQVFGMLNVERVTAAISGWGAGKEALDRGVQYAKDREVWSEPIGAHQAIQHPLAEAHTKIESARTQLRKAAWKYDNGAEDVGETANIAKYLAAQAGWEAAEASMSVHGGMSASQEMGIAACWGVARHQRTGPVSEEMILNHIGQHVLGLPRSYGN
ncbi:acyl-CoA dehydrogenase family protein [Halosolutus halophilus]|uniref:acyl-CoA dehydrogenase family protein n=1 Tax=Halosolutus halophilus TaxID=1552990 RepID=UPI0022350D7B|nr:acyl-CoA dehydrogenase family protein [Halosolutus halophilus]